MALEIEGMAETHDLVVLHRQSSHYGLARATKVSHPFIAQVEIIHDKGTVLYGDDLEDAAQWLIEKMGASRRPSVFLTGAWSNPEWGCVTALGQALQRSGATVAVSQSSPSDRGTTENQWNPDLPVDETPMSLSAPRFG
jgi:NADPH-dependent 2,4-dienoyl-CoA reductase/sulfur reductase-like enzyme